MYVCLDRKVPRERGEREKGEEEKKRRKEGEREEAGNGRNLKGKGTGRKKLKPKKDERNGVKTTY